MTAAVHQVRYQRPPMYPKQEAALFCPERYSVVEASTKSGKTVGCIVWLHELAALQGGPNRNFWWVAPIRRVAGIAYRRLKAFLPAGSFGHNETNQTITLANGSVIWFLGAENPDTLYGEDVYGAVIDEATRVSADSWYAVRSTLTATQGPVRIIGNVKGSRNWAYKLARRAESGVPDMHYAKLTVWDAVEAGIFPESEAHDARETLPDSIYRELYLAEPADEGTRFFETEKILPVKEWPESTARVCRVWDFAVTDESAGGDPDYTVGGKIAIDGRRLFLVDVVRERSNPNRVIDLVRRTAVEDGPTCTQLFEEEKGAAGKMMLDLFKRTLAGTGAGRVRPAPVTGGKEVRAFHFAADCNAGNVSIVYGPWNEAFIAEADDFPHGGHDDQIDVFAHGYNFLRPNLRTRIRWL